MGLPNFSSPNQEDNWLQDKVIKKTFVSIKQFWGKSGKHDFWTIVSYYEGSPFLIVRMLTHYCPKVRKRDNV